MESSIHSASLRTTIKCSTCSVEVEITAMTAHVCHPVSQTPFVAEPQSVEPLVFASPPGSLSSIRLGKPFVPRIDPFAPSRPLTPSSGHSSSIISPTSAGSGWSSPMRHVPRTGSVTASRRPLSPGLTSQDCAFPPFPTTKNRRKDEGLVNRAKTPDGGRTTPNGLRPSLGPRSASYGVIRQRSRPGTSESSLPSTANSSRRPSLSSNGGSRHGSVDAVPPLPPPGLSLTRGNTNLEEGTTISPQTLAWSLSISSTSADVAVASSDLTPDPGESGYTLTSLPEDGREGTSALTQVVVTSASTNPGPAVIGVPEESPPVSSTTSTAHVKEPSYRAKRPPPIVQPSPHATEENGTNHQARNNAVPSSATGVSFARTLTGLLGLRRSQSANAKRKAQPTPPEASLRCRALGPEDDEDVRPISRQQANKSDESTSFRSPNLQTESKHEARLESLNDVRMSPIAGIFRPRVMEETLAENPLENTSNGVVASAKVEVEKDAEPPAQEKGSLGIENDCEPTLGSAMSSPDLLEEVSSPASDLKRASVDSASSYGSIGFSHSSTSSRSTNPTEELARDSIAVSETGSSAYSGFELLPDSKADSRELAVEQIAELPAARLPTVPEPETGPPSFVDQSLVNSEGLQGSPVEVVSTDVSHKRRPSTPGGNKGFCRGCSRLIMNGQRSVSSKDGQLSGRYHKECFVCWTCESPFATADFYIHEDRPYCAHHYHVVNDTLCTSCGKGIEGEYMGTSTVSGQVSKKFHPHCLRCATCKVQLRDDYFELNGRVYCEKDAFRMANSPRSPYDTAPSRPSPLVREYISSGEPGLSGKFPERRVTRLMMTL